MASKAKTGLDYKNEGNNFLKSGNIKEAIECYSKAIELEPENSVFFANRAAAQLKINLFEEALEDANRSTELDPTYGKAYGRTGLALFNLKRYEESLEAYTKALDITPNSNVFQRQLNRVEKFVNITLPNIKEHIAELPTKNTNDAENLARELIRDLQQIANYDDPEWLETIGRIQAFMGRLCFARGAWTGTYENFEVALENLRASKTEQSVPLIANFLGDYLLVKTKLQKEVKPEEVDEALALSEAVFYGTSIRHAQTLEVIARVAKDGLQDFTKTALLLKTGLQICLNHPSDERGQHIMLNIDKALSDIFYKTRNLDESAKHQIRVINNPSCKAGDKAVAQFSVAVIYKLRGELAEAQAKLTPAIEFFESIKHENRTTGQIVPNHQLPRMVVLQAEIYISEERYDDAEVELEKAEGYATILGLDTMVQTIHIATERIKQARKGELKPELKFPSKPVIQHSSDEDESMELVDKFNSTNIHPDAGKDLPFKRTKLGTNCEFIGDGIEKLMMDGQNIHVGNTKGEN